MTAPRVGTDRIAAALALSFGLALGALTLSGALPLRFGPALLAFAPERGGAVVELSAGLTVEVGRRRIGITFGAGEDA